MSDQTESMNIRCLCGASAFSAPVPSSSLPLSGGLCHCNSCRHTTGSLFMPTIPWPSKIPDSTTLSVYPFSPNVNLYFCETCGTHLFSHPHDLDDHQFVSTGALEDPSKFVSFAEHCYLGDTLDGGMSDWVSAIAGTPLVRWSDEDTTSAQLPPRWSSAAAPQSSTVHEGDTLPAHCHCGGVRFRISRPNEDSKKNPYRDPVDAATDFPLWWLGTRGRYTASVCACTSCRRASGTDVVQWAFVPLANLLADDGRPFVFSGEGASCAALKAYRSSEDVLRYFCGRCGATVFWFGEDRNGMVDVAVGLLQAESGARAEEWLHWERRVGFEDDAVHTAFLEALKAGMAAAGVEDRGRR